MTVRVLGLKSGTTPEDHRLGLSLFMQPYSGALERRAGVVYYPGSADLVSVSAMQAKVTPFLAWVDGTSAALQGGYPLAADADVTLTFANGEASVARVDRVIARVRDNPYDSSGSQAGSVEYLQGQASGTATALPAGSLLLWEVTVPAGTTAGGGGINFSTARSDKRTYTTGLGGPIPVANQAARDALTAYDHLRVWRMDTRAQEYYDGSTSSWKSSGGGGLGTPTFTMAGSISTGTGTVRFYNDTGAPLVIKGVRASVGTAPTGAAIIVDVNINGTTIFTTQANRPTIAASGFTSGKVTSMDVTSWPDGNYVTVDIDQRGSTVAGADLTVQVIV